MKIFWGEEAPLEAVFDWRPFFPGASLPFSGPIERVSALPPPTRPISIRSRFLYPGKQEWFAMVRKAKERIRKGELEKVVLARKITLECERAPDPLAIVSALQRKAMGATLFCLLDKGKAFIGASPERLFSRQHDRLTSFAVAGTRKRGGTQREDAKLEKELLLSHKDFREWFPIQQHLQKNLSPLCQNSLTFSPLRVHKTQNVQHLFSQCQGRLLSSLSDAEILARIHPTPALCGAPQEKAFSLIRELEPFERGLYGGAIGWSTPERSEWIVAIRCCLVEENLVHLYAGTGIVEESDPEEEWEELNQKTRLYEGIFT